jgi:hypothetical protein
LFEALDQFFSRRKEDEPMSDLLAITQAGTADRDDDLVAEVARHHPSRVTILVEGANPSWGSDEGERSTKLRDRLAYLLAAIERRTGATVAGVACEERQLAGWRFDWTVRTGMPAAA